MPAGAFSALLCRAFFLRSGATVQGLGSEAHRIKKAQREGQQKFPNNAKIVQAFFADTS
jgi:hypothetical protein